MLTSVQGIINKYENPDVIIFNHYSYDGKNKTISYENIFSDKKDCLISKEKVLREYLMGHSVVSMCGKIVKRICIDIKQDYSEYGRLSTGEDTLQSLEFYSKEETILFGIIVIFSLLGVLDMGGVKINKGSYITDGVSLGFTHPNMLAAQGTSIILLYLCLNKDKLKTRHYIVSLMCEILLFVLSKGRSSFFLGIFAIILIGMSKMNIIKKIILKFLPFAYWAILGALIFCMFIYARDNGTSAISGLINDGFFNGRIGLAYRSLLVYPITIFGKAIDTSIWNQYQYYSLDNGQVMVLLEYGIVGFLTYFYIIQTILKEVKKEEEVVWGIIIIVFMIWSMYEGTMYFIGKNFVFLFLGLNKNSMVVNLKKEKKYDS